MRYEDDYGFEEIKSPARRGASQPKTRKRPASDSARPTRGEDGSRNVKKRAPASERREALSSGSGRGERYASDQHRAKKPVSGSERASLPKSRPKSATRPAADSERARRAEYARPGGKYGYDERQPRRAPASARPAKRRAVYDEEYAAPVKKRAPARGKRKRQSSGGLTFLWVAVALVLAFAVSSVLHNNVFDMVRLSGDSMYATIKRGDIVLIDKLKKSEISRGDLVAVSLKGKNGYIIRRIVGLPGETVSIVSGKTYIDSNAINERYIGLETYDSFEGMTLPTNKYYILCDNRTDLSDSRATDISMVDVSQIKGKVSLRIWPFDRFGSIQ